MTNDEEKQTRK